MRLQASYLGQTFPFPRIDFFTHCLRQSYRQYQLLPDALTFRANRIPVSAPLSATSESSDLFSLPLRVLSERPGLTRSEHSSRS